MGALLAAGAAILIMSTQIYSCTPVYDTKIDKEFIFITEEVSKNYSNKIPTEIIVAMIEKESNGNQNATGKLGEQGLLQIRPEFQKARIKKLKIDNLYDPKDNIRCGVDLLYQLSQKYGDIENVIMAYNYGEYSKTFKNHLKNKTVSEYARTIVDRANQLKKESKKCIMKKRDLS